MGLKSRRRGRRPRAIALACCSLLAATLAATPFTPGPSALARALPAVPGPNPLAHAPGFGRAFGQRVLADPGGVAVDPAGDIWVADTGHDRIAEFAPSGRLVTTFGKHLDQPAASVATPATTASRSSPRPVAW